MVSTRQELQQEKLPELRKRSYYCWDKELAGRHKSTITELIDKATLQAQLYLRVAKDGPVKGRGGGILDGRIICETGEDQLVACVVIGIGGTRVIAWRVGKVQTRFSFRKSSSNADRIHRHRGAD